MKNMKPFFAMSAGILLVIGLAFAVAGRASAQDIRGDKAEPVELNGDTIEYKAEEGKFIATGNVYLKQNNAVLFCDRLEFYRDKKEGHAEGNVILDTDKGKIWAEKAFYNFETKKGEFTNARIMADPIYGRARSIVKVRENYYVIHDGYTTTSDYDEPEYRMTSKTIEIYQGEKAVARNSVMSFGGLPVMFFPKYSQDLSGKKPHFSVIPGYKKGFGAFVLTTYSVPLNDPVDMSYHIDERELKGFAWGVDAKYRTDSFGAGLVRRYILYESTSDARRAWQKNLEPAVKQDRSFLEWRHQMQIDPNTSFIGQYYTVTDPEFVKKYYPREYQADPNPSTYAMVTHTTAVTTASLRLDKRVNRYETMVERLPEASFNVSSLQLGDTGFYFKSANTATHLIQKTPGAEDRGNMRIDSDNELSRPFKLAFLEMRPFTGIEGTYNSRTLNPENNDSVRRLFRTGMDVSTKFYRVYKANFKKYGIEVNNLRHVITPTVGYLYQYKPSMPSAKFYQYDGVDSRDRADIFSLGLENKLQTKRDGKSVDLVRALLSSSFRLKDNPSSSSFGDVTLDTDLTPNQYVALYSDVTYDPDQRNLKTANVDLYLNNNRNWTFDLSRRFTHDEDDIVTPAIEFKLNPKWRLGLYQRWNVDTGKWQEKQYAVSRDLHSWEMELAVKTRRGFVSSNGTEFWIIFRIKAFPSAATGNETFFNRIKAGPGSNI
jgi:lipopolysaccharide assembly outer membrane protein LptD (OstA)